VASIERTAYPRFKRYYTLAQLQKTYTPTSTEIAFARSNTQGDKNFFSLMVLLKSFQRLGYFPSLDQITQDIINYLRDYLKLPENIDVGYDQSRTLYRHKKEIRAYFQVTAFDKQARDLIGEAVSRSALVMDNPADLINVAIEMLVKDRYELPGFNSLNRLVCRLRTTVNDQLFSQVILQLDEKYLNYLDSLLENHPVHQRSPYNDLKKLPKKSSRNHLNDLLVHLTWLESLGDIAPYLQTINSSKIQHWAAEAKSLDASEIKKITQPKRATLLLCLIYTNVVNTRDYLVTMFLKQMKKVHNKAKEKLELIRQQLQEKVEAVVGVFANVLPFFADESPEAQWSQVRQILQAGGGVDHLLSECDAINAYRGNNHSPLLWQFYKSHRSSFLRLINALQLESTSTDLTLIKAIQFLKDNAHRRGNWLSGFVSLSFASVEWQKFVLSGQKDSSKISRRHFEVCVFSYLASELKSGDICVLGSQDYADYRLQLLSWSDCLPLLDQYCDNLGYPNNSNDFVEHLKSWLDETAKQVDDGYPNNSQIVINEFGEPILKRLNKKADNPSLKALESLIEEKMPERNLIDILKNVDYWTNFTRHFGPLSGSDPKLERATERYLLTLFTYGCNLGPYQAARHMRGLATAHELSFVNRRHINLSKLNSALVDILNRYHVLELPTFWGKGTSAAADGTKYDLYEQNLLSEYHIRYGGYGGIAYHHVADSYIALFSHFIPCGTWEAVYIIDGLLKNSSLIQPKTLHADTQGQSTPVFALSHLLGIKLMPRIRNWKDLTFYRPDKNTTYQHIDSLFSDSINWKLIETHWQDLFRIVLSISTGKISSAVLLRKLGNYSRKNRLYKAFQELGRVVRTVFLLEYISDAKLRRQIQAATNKVESYNGFSKWFCFGGEGIIANNDPEEQEKIIKYNTLVSNAVVFQNTVDLTEIIQQLKREGHLIAPEDLKALSPYLTEHIKRFGDYWLDLNICPKALDEMMILGI
jgi:TnpA family transposase